MFNLYMFENEIPLNFVKTALHSIVLNMMYGTVKYIHGSTEKLAPKHA